MSHTIGHFFVFETKYEQYCNFFPIYCRFLRKSVSTFKNTTGYVKKPVYREKPEPKPVESTEIKNKKEVSCIIW